MFKKNMRNKFLRPGLLAACVLLASGTFACFYVGQQRQQPQASGRKNCHLRQAAALGPYPVCGLRAVQDVVWRGWRDRMQNHWQQSGAHHPVEAEKGIFRKVLIRTNTIL